MVSRSFSGVPWYSKNWLILKIQPSGSVPLNRGTSNFILWLFAGIEGEGGGVGEEDEERMGVTQLRSSSIF